MGEGQATKGVGLGFMGMAGGFVEGALLEFATLGLRTVGFFKQAETIIESSIEIIERISKAQTEKSLDDLFKNLSKKEVNDYSRNPDKGSRWIGQAIHRGTDKGLDSEFPERFDYSTKGPDFYDNLTG